MQVLADPDHVLAHGLDAIRQQFDVPQEFAPEIEAEAKSASLRAPTDHADWTDRNFVTLDPATSTDLDQAFVIEESGGDLLLHYALADIGWFVPFGSAVEAEAWRRGVTLYLPDGRARLYPAVLSEGAASLLPDGPRPAIVATVRCAANGQVRLEGMTRAVIRSRAKLAYETVDLNAIPFLEDFAGRMKRGEEARGAARIDAPDQVVERCADGQYTLSLRPWLPSERVNSFLSLAANMAIADALLAAGTGLFREMAPPDDKAIARLRATARGLNLSWPPDATLAQFERTVDSSTNAGAMFDYSVKRATGHARYVPFTEGHIPWHAALGATYTHATAPMRRLADRYILEAALAVTNGRAVPTDAEGFARLAKTMDSADAREGAIERAVLELAEAVLMAGREGEGFSAVVTERDERGARIQLCDLPILARVDTKAVAAGDMIQVRLARADTTRREIAFERVR